MNRYLALLRGVNVGGRMLSMAALRESMEKDGFENVKTFIQSGNVFFDSSETNTDKLAAAVSKHIKTHFDMDVEVAVFTKSEWQKIIDRAPKWWGVDKTWKHNLLVLLKPYDMSEVIKDVGELKPDIEAMEPGEGVLYQSMSFKLFGRTTTGKLASKPVYKRMTIRNYNTSNKLLALFD